MAGLAVSLALQNTLSNLAGGIMLLVTKPFQVGDYVEADGVGGTIAAVDLSYTTFVTVDNKEIFVPNSQLSAAKIVNYSALGRRRVELTVNEMCIRDRGIFHACPAKAMARSRMRPAAASLDRRGSSSTRSRVIRVMTLVSTPKPAPSTFKLLAQIISTFFFSSLTRLFSSISRVSMEKPQMIWSGRRCSPRSVSYTHLGLRPSQS